MFIGENKGINLHNLPVQRFMDNPRGQTLIGFERI